MPPSFEPRDDPRMSDFEALMWTIEKDPRLSASIANVTILDRPPDPERLRARMSMAAQAVPRLRQRVVPGFGRLAPPEWRDDPDFALERHLRWRGLPSPRSMRQLFDLATDVVNDPFDRTRPLWEFVVVEDLDDGRAAMIQKLHHSVTDGVGGVRMSAQFLDLERDATEPLVAAHPVPSPPPTSTSLLGTVVATARHDARRALGIARRAAGAAAGMAVHPGRVPGVIEDGAAVARSAARQLVVTGTSRSPLWRTRTLHRRFDVVSVPFDPAKRAAERLGGSLNDLFVTAAVGAAGAYHRARGVDVDELRMAMPINTRVDRSSTGNAFTPARVLVPAGIEDPKARFAAVRERMRATKGEPAMSVVTGLAGLANLLPTSVLVRLATAQTEVVDFTTSNVRGAPFDLYVAGAKIEANYPVGPLAGTAFNLTLLSYAGKLGMGLNVDTGAVDDPDDLCARIEAAFEELLALA